MEKAHNVKRCPKCGASELEYDISKQKLVCNYCHSEFEQEKIEQEDLEKLEGYKISDGSKAITDNNDLIVLKCDNCGAEVVINSNDNNYRCHWCHSVLSLNSKIVNGMVPDLILPFKISKEDARSKIDSFVSNRKFFSDKMFKREFKVDNIIGVYFPYLLIDCNCHANFCGDAGHVARSYTKVVGKDKDGNEEKKTFYDIDVYSVVRDFDITIDDLEIESSKDKINKSNKEKTTNIINSIMPFDTANCVKYESNYLVGFNAEKRDLNIYNLEDKIDKSIKDIVRHSIKGDLKYYDGGVSWKNENIKYIGKQITSAFLPVWLYSYLDKHKVLHYVAVNGRTGETMGSVPLNKFRLAFMSILIFLLFISIPFIFALIMYNTDKDAIIVSAPVFFFCFILGTVLSLVLLFTKLSKYRNKGARHKYEVETKTNISNLERQDIKRTTLYEESFSFINGINSNKIEGDSVTYKE